MPKGRKSLFKRELIEKAEALAGLGFTNEQIAHFFSINTDTLYTWAKKHPDFAVALKRGQTRANHEVVKSLYQRALGYTYDEVTYEKTKPGGVGVGLIDGEVESIKHIDTYKVKVTTKQVPPDVTAQIFWLKNRLPDSWREKKDPEGKTPTELNLALTFVTPKERIIERNAATLSI